MITIEQAQSTKEFFDTFINENVNLVWSVIKQHYGFVLSSEDKDDYFQVGCIGLIKAAKRFDLSYECKFSTYAVPLIFGEIQRYRRDYDNGSAYKVRRSTIELFNKQLNLRKQGKTDNEICTELGIDFDKLYDVRNAMKGTISINEICFHGNDFEATFDEYLSSDNDTERDVISNLSISEKYKILVNRLKDKERKAIELKVFNNLTQNEIAKQLGITQAHVSRILRKAKKVAEIVNRDYEEDCSYA